MAFEEGNGITIPEEGAEKLTTFGAVLDCLREVRKKRKSRIELGRFQVYHIDRDGAVTVDCPIRLSFPEDEHRGKCDKANYDDANEKGKISSIRLAFDVGSVIDL